MGVAQTTDPQNAPQTASGAPEDPFDREVRFIQFLLGESLFPFANLALEDLRRAYPNDPDRIEVVEVMIQLRLGRTAQVEEILSRRNLRTDPKAQAILLQLAQTYELMGKRDEARERYAQFLQLTEGRDITDPDVLRYFAGAALRLVSMLQERGDYAQAAQVITRVMNDADGDALKRKFRILLIQNHIDHGRGLQGSDRRARLADAEKQIEEILWGANDNYWFMAMAQKAWVDHLNGKSQEALATLNSLRTNAQRLEREMERLEIPKSEFPRATTRYVTGMIHFDLAQAAMQRQDIEAVRAHAGQSAGQLYNAFLQYEGNDYARRAGLHYETVRVWVRENLGIEIGVEGDPAAVERIFKRNLDLAGELMLDGQYDQAERILLTALSQYPLTTYTKGALNSLGRIWTEQDRDWELMALALYVADLFPDDLPAANMLRNWGSRMFQKENELGIETILGVFGRRFPGHPAAAPTLFEIARRAQDRGDPETARRFFNDVVEHHPGSATASRVLFTQAAEALNAQNYEEAIRVFSIVNRQAPPGMLRFRAAHGIADAKLRMDDDEKRQEGLAELEALRDRLTASPITGSDAEAAQNMLQRVRFDIGSNLIRFARREDSDALRTRAVNELTAFLRDHPDSEFVPNAMHGLGRIHLQQGRFDDATRMFERLEAEHSDTDFGRDARFALVSAALEEERLEVAQEAVRRMIEQPEGYETEQIFVVGGLMLNHGRYEEALGSFELVLKSNRAATDGPFRQRVTISLGRAAHGAGQPEKAVEALEALITQFPNSSLVVDGGILLSEIYLSMGETDKAEAALRPAARIVSSRRTPVNGAKIGLAAGDLAQARGNTGEALGNYFGVALSNPESPEHANLVRAAIEKSLELAEPLARGGDARQWALIDDLTTQYLKHFHLDRRAPEMSELQGVARRARPREAQR